MYPSTVTGYVFLAPAVNSFLLVKTSCSPSRFRLEGSRVLVFCSTKSHLLAMGVPFCCCYHFLAYQSQKNCLLHSSFSYSCHLGCSLHRRWWEWCATLYAASISHRDALCCECGSFSCKTHFTTLSEISQLTPLIKLWKSKQLAERPENTSQFILTTNACTKMPNSFHKVNLGSTIFIKSGNSSQLRGAQ